MPARRLHLMTSNTPERDRPLATSAEPAHAEVASAEEELATESSALQRMRLERDAALEDIAFLREQLRSTEAFYAYRFELVCARLHAEHRNLLGELTRLGAERLRRPPREDPEQEETRAAPVELADTVPAEPADTLLLPRTR